MSDFVEQCRQEWSRLGVPDPLAEEMAADLSADLAEAEAEGVSTEELLGRSAFDPRSFARSWADERGVIPVPPSRGTRRRPLVLVAFTAFAAIALVFASLALATHQPKVSLAAVKTTRSHLPSPPQGFFVRPGAGPHSRQVLFHTSTSAPVEWVMLFLAIVALGFAAWLWLSWSRSRPPIVPA
jgi:hypothetical protein